MLRLYNVVKRSGFVIQDRVVKNATGVTTKVTACIDKCRMDTLKSDNVTIGVFLFTIKVMEVTVTISTAKSAADKMM